MPRAEHVLRLVISAVLLSGCSKEEPRRPSIPVEDSVSRLIADESSPSGERLDAMQALGKDATEAQIEALLRVMSDKSQQAFLLQRVDSDLGYRAIESEFGGADDRAELRWTAVQALDRLQVLAAWPDLISALNDRHPVVRNHAARALFRLGSPAGLPVLLKDLEEKAFGNETANRILREITGWDAGFSTDAGWTRKLEAIERWKQRLATNPPATPRRPPLPGEDAMLDRRASFLVDMLGQHQFLFMEQARRNLTAMGDYAVDRIRRAFEDRDRPANQQLRAYAAQVLEGIGSEGARELLRSRLADADASVRARSALALGRLGDVAACERLVVALDDADESVALAAVRALGGLSGAADKAAAALKGRTFGAGRSRLVASLARLRLGDRGEAADFVLDRLAHGDVDERVELAETLKEWQGEKIAYDPDRSGDEQPAAVEAWRRFIRGQ